MHHHERRLPHWNTTEAPLFVTFRLHGTLPRSRVFPPANLTSGIAFVTMDRLLDHAQTGPRYLAIPEIAKIVAATLHAGATRFRNYDLHSFVIMPNHVHLLVTPHVPSPRWLGPLKGSSAYQANRLLARTGQPFWQDESYDRLVRDSAEFRRIQNYIENNPVMAGLAKNAADFPWSSGAATPGCKPALAGSATAKQPQLP